MSQCLCRHRRAHYEAQILLELGARQGLSRSYRGPNNLNAVSFKGPVDGSILATIRVPT